MAVVGSYMEVASKKEVYALKITPLEDNIIYICILQRDLGGRYPLGKMTRCSHNL